MLIRRSTIVGSGGYDPNSKRVIPGTSTFSLILSLLGPVLTATIKWINWERALGVLGLYDVNALLDGLVLQPYPMRRTAKVPVWPPCLRP